MTVFDLHIGDAPVIVSMPHGGLHIPPDCRTGLRDPITAIADADWWIDQVYAPVFGPECTILKANLSRVAIDLNRDPSGQSLYPGQATTELCPTISFDGDPLYVEGAEPGPREIARRLAAYYRPYHDALAAQIERLRAKHRCVIVYDAHSIRSRVPRLFGGELPVFNIGTNNGASCDPDLASAVLRICQDSGMSAVLNGRFKGGWITRHYSRVAQGVHTIQMELAQRSYMAEPGGTYDAQRAEPLTRTLERVRVAIFDWVREMGDQP